MNNIIIAVEKQGNTGFSHMITTELYMELSNWISLHIPNRANAIEIYVPQFKDGRYGLHGRLLENTVYGLPATARSMYERDKAFHQYINMRAICLSPCVFYFGSGTRDLFITEARNRRNTGVKKGVATTANPHIAYDITDSLTIAFEANSMNYVGVTPNTIYMPPDASLMENAHDRRFELI